MLFDVLLIHLDTGEKSSVQIYAETNDDALEYFAEYYPDHTVKRAHAIIDTNQRDYKLPKRGKTKKAWYED